MRYFNTLNEETKTYDEWLHEIESEEYHKNVISRHYTEEGDYAEEEVCLTPQEYMLDCLETGVIVLLG